METNTPNDTQVDNPTVIVVGDTPSTSPTDESIADVTGELTDNGVADVSEGGATPDNEIPQCDCGYMNGDHQLGLPCPNCGTTCRYHLEINADKNPAPISTPPIDDSPLKDYIGFEQYLTVMRATHGYENMPLEQARNFDAAVIHRWRDARALSKTLSAISNDPASNPARRIMDELRRVNALVDHAYIELATLRHGLGLQIGKLNKLAVKARKAKNTTQAMVYESIASTMSTQLSLIGDIKQAPDLQSANIALRVLGDKHDKLISGVMETAEYHYGHERTNREAGDNDRADRHKERGDALMKLARGAM